MGARNRFSESQSLSKGGLRSSSEGASERGCVSCSYTIQFFLLCPDGYQASGRWYKHSNWVLTKNYRASLSHSLSLPSSELLTTETVRIPAKNPCIWIDLYTTFSVSNQRAQHAKFAQTFSKKPAMKFCWLILKPELRILNIGEKWIIWWYPLYLPSHTVRFPLDQKQNLGRHVTHTCFFASQKEIPKFLHNPWPQEDTTTRPKREWWQRNAVSSRTNSDQSRISFLYL